MQLQVEFNCSLIPRHVCVVCGQKFEMAEARVIVCDDGGSSCGDVCPDCIAMGPDRLWSRLLNPSSAFSGMKK
ncbi:MAG: hypothetical protein WCA35_04860 [Kovacikia sp.]